MRKVPIKTANFQGAFASPVAGSLTSGSSSFGGGSGGQGRTAANAINEYLSEK